MLLFMDGQAHYDNGRIGAKYSTVGTDYCTWALTAEGRTGNCIKRVSTSNAFPPGYLAVAPLTTRLGAWTPTASGVCGFAVKVDDLAKAANTPSSFASWATPGAFFVVMEGPNYHVQVVLNDNGTLSLQRNNFSSPVLLAQSSEGLSNNTWMFVEFKWTIHDTTGYFQIRVNKVPVLTFSGRTTDSYGAGHPYLGIWNAVRLLGVEADPQGGAVPYLTMRMCDLYLADLAFSTADDVHDYMGDGNVVTIFPNAPGASTGWTPSVAPNWDATNDKPVPDDDSTYVAATAPGLKDIYQFEDIPAGSLVLGAHVNILARKETAGSASLAPIVRPASTDFQGTTQGVANTIYDHYITQPYDLNPETLVKFTDTQINNGQFGVVKVD